MRDSPGYIAPGICNRVGILVEQKISINPVPVIAGSAFPIWVHVRTNAGKIVLILSAKPQKQVWIPISSYTASL